MEKSNSANLITGHFLLDISKGVIPGHKSINKFGRSTNLDAAVATDIHDGANATDALAIWVAPTQARTHQIKSTDAKDTGAESGGSPTGVGARTIKIWGLKSWITKEVSEIVVLDGTSNVATANKYVIIHEMEVISNGVENVNVGVITATADTESTVTAQINAGNGHTEMAIQGIPSIQTAYMTQFYGDLENAAAAQEIIFRLLVNHDPLAELTNFGQENTRSTRGGGTSNIEHTFSPYKKIEGPAIIKLQGTGDAADMSATAGFDLIIVDN